MGLYLVLTFTLFAWHVELLSHKIPRILFLSADITTTITKEYQISRFSRLLLLYSLGWRKHH
jgi:hypothetical protein